MWPFSICIYLYSKQPIKPQALSYSQTQSSCCFHSQCHMLLAQNNLPSLSVIVITASVVGRVMVKAGVVLAIVAENG